ncbi:LysM peptidoglycan-binding domain-containing protein [Allohahella sp. A8]|uniref:LysM peptidoglycan-binding domain-containing protein n=1 Tax=Allohahella sp. A8 TaxID=3141461 RepID=UPI003A80BFB7
MRNLGVLLCALVLLYSPVSNADPVEATGLNSTASITPAGPVRLNDPSEPGGAVRLPASKPSIWKRVRKGLSLYQRQDHPRIDDEIRFLKRNPSYLDITLRRAQPYLHFIVSEAEKRKVPLEFALLPIVESAYDPFAYSHGRAAGLWQFIPMTGQRFNLRQSWWYDGRRDVYASTQAAFKYLSALHRFFDGDWLHALAGYNAGEGNVRKAVNANKARKRPYGYWHLQLPRETELYVPRLMAIARVVANPAAYGITLPYIADAPFFEIVEIKSQIDLAQAAKLANLSIDDIYRMNPGFNQWATDPDGPHRLLIPKTHAAAFRTELALLPESQRLKWHRYLVRSGDTLSEIAQRFKTTRAVVRDVNQIKGDRLKIGQALLIPTASKRDEHYTLNVNNRVQQAIANVNPRAGSSKIVHTVKAGDTLWDLANTYDVSVGQLAKWNSMAPGDPLRAGADLTLWVPAEITKRPGSIALNGVNPQNTVRKFGYTVRDGDSISRIAAHYNVSMDDLLRWNSIRPGSILRPGQRLTVFVDVTQLSH